jgi:hypothetical protein
MDNFQFLGSVGKKAFKELFEFYNSFFDGQVIFNDSYFFDPLHIKSKYD